VSNKDLKEKPPLLSDPHRVTLSDIPAVVQQHSNTDSDFFNFLNVDFNRNFLNFNIMPEIQKYRSRSDMPVEVTKEIKTRSVVVQIVNCTD
jgi:hypothetical protein